MTRDTKDRSAVIKRLQGVAHSSLDDLINVGSPVALLDFPDHDNVGDSAIYLGELAYLDKLRLSPAYVSTAATADWPSLDRFPASGPILIHGGGNFGDLWPWFQRFREEVLSRFPGRPIVQLPQTIFYRDQANLDRTARIIERHSAFTLLVRDQPSLELAQRFFQCDVRLCPDMAFFLGPLQRLAPEVKTLFHLRTDQESVGHEGVKSLANDKDALLADWPAEQRHFGAITALPHSARLAAALTRGGRKRYSEARFRLLAERRVARGVSLLSRGKYVVTDRLHGHILSLLLDIPHCVLDNSYGKTRNFIKAWSTTGPEAVVVETLSQARRWSAQQPS